MLFIIHEYVLQWCGYRAIGDRTVCVQERKDGAMKMRTRMIISFVIIAVLPAAMMLAVLKTYLYVHGRTIHELMNGADAEFFGDAAVSILIILFLTAVILIAWSYGTYVSRIDILTKAAERIKQGDLDFTIESRGKDEIDELAESFEEMRARLKESMTEKLRYEEDQKQLISNIAHDLKSPLTSIQGYAEGILDGVADTEEKREAYVRTILSKAREMNTLLSELSLYSRIDTNRIPYNFAHVNVGAFFTDAVEELSMDLSNKGVTLHFANYVSDSVEMIVDPEQIRRVINNIIGNSVKYKGDDPLAIAMRITDAGDFIQAEFEDNGRGIKREDLPYIFDRSFRGDASRNTNIGGSGFGLSIAKKIISDHGGRIWATSSEGHGTAMYFVLRKYFATPVTGDAAEGEEE